MLNGGRKPETIWKQSRLWNGYCGGEAGPDSAEVVKVGLAFTGAWFSISVHI